MFKYHSWHCCTLASLRRSALLPLDVHDLSELEVGGVGGEETRGRGVGAGQADLGVDVEQAVLAARRPNNGRAVRLVVLGVITIDGAGESVAGRSLFMC